MNLLSKLTGPWPYPTSDGIPVEVDDLHGIWTRSLISWHGGPDDTTTTVTWLQSDGWYADLRQPAGRPDFDGVTCLRDLRAEHLEWMFAQEGFAGSLTRSPVTPARFTWGRLVDWAPAEGVADTGTLHFENAMMVERGIELPYLEHWHHVDGTDRGPRAVVTLRDAESGARAILLRTGAKFAFARSRTEEISALPTPDEVPRLDLSAAQDLADCEIAIGSISPTGWHIDISSLPFRQGHSFVATDAGDELHILDLEPARPRPRPIRWRIESLVGAFADLLTE
ncbi:hypothetical protein [Nocardia spumae]|uniref:hypothetical protein n=1 Tax=Nocardia spumae TaxID=2887190 RepID=UPI001D14252D|nr:hypothetical protein [Nocardia spumae]